MSDRAWTTKQVAQMLKVKTDTLLQLVWLGKVIAPRRFGHSYQWTELDVERLCWKLHSKPLDRFLHDQGEVL